MADVVRTSRLRELFTLVHGDEPDQADEDEAPPAEEEVDWHNPPPGFMALPGPHPRPFPV